jgi:hypothetical protein
MRQTIPPCRVAFRRSARAALALSALFALSALPVLSGPVLSGDTAAAQPGPVLLAAAGEARLELPSGQRVTARLPEGAVLDVTASLDIGESGWLAAGTQPAAGPSTGPSAARDLLLLTGDGQTVTTLPAPPEKTGSVRQEPLPLVDGGRLAGLVWLEGENRRSFGVRFAAWNGAGWESPEIIAPPGPGSQLALTAAHLRDGSWLLAWSAFDGHDDEIVWSRRPGGANGSWSRPQRVAADNSVPDITPALTAVNGGALLAWSRYDTGLGEYQVVVSRFDKGRWTAPVATGPAGSLYPTFEPSSALDPSNAARMLYRTAGPRGWEVLDLDAAGRVSRRAAIVNAASARPVVTSAAAGNPGVLFRWPASGAESTVAWSPEEGKR